MKKFLLFFLTASLLLSGRSSAQRKKLSIEDAVIGQWRELYPETLSRLSWIPETDSYYFLEGNNLQKQQVNSDEPQNIITLSELNQTLGLTDKDEQLGYFPPFSWLDSETIQFKFNDTWYQVNLEKPALIGKTQIDEQAQNEDFSDASDYFAYTKENNLYLASFYGDSRQITDEPNSGIVCGQEVHRREFGIHTGTFWSPGGQKLAFYRKDETMVTDYPLVDITSRVAEYQPEKYPMAGMKSHHVTIGIYDLQSENTLYLKTGKPADKYLTSVTWGPDGEFLYVAVLNRDQDHLKLNKYSAQDGSLVKTLLEEKDERYVEPQMPLIFLPANPDRFIWMSRRDGFNHMYLYNTKGELIKQLTKGSWEVNNDFIEFGSKGKYVYFSANHPTPIERHTFRVNLKNSKISQITKEPGYHLSQLSGEGDYLIDNYSSMDQPRTIEIINDSGEKEKQLLVAENPLKNYELGEAEISTLKSPDGETDLYYRLIKPADFDPSKKYPAIVYVYGGPHAQLVQNRWLGGARMWQYYMAQEGYVMLTLDNRGSANRGMEFESIIHRNLGVHELADQMKGVELLKSLDYIDTNRLGVHGWSYGGFMTTSLMLKELNTFKVGVAGGPVIDWNYYEIMYGERYMDTPQDNPEGYENANLKHYVNNLEGRLMLIHGYIDNVVVPQHSLSFIRECVKNDVSLDFFFYPRHEHNVRGMDRIHLMKKVTRYFEDHL